MKQKKTLQILLLVFAGLIVLYTGVNLYQKQQSSKEDSDQTMISDLKSLTSISYNNNGTTLSFIKQNGKWYYTKNKKCQKVKNKKIIIVKNMDFFTKCLNDKQNRKM